MSSSVKQVERPRALRVGVSDDELTVDLDDGRTIVVPLSWYPRLEHATSEERQRWELIGNDTGIHWEAVDEDISVDALVRGKPSSESQASFRSWLAARTLHP
jgi:hypothetical protein